MADQSKVARPGVGLVVTGDGVPQPVEVPYVDDATVALVHRNLLFGGMPGSGKSVLLNLPAASAAVAVVDCLACPRGCPSCTEDECTCECYEHAHLHPDNEPNGPEVA